MDRIQMELQEDGHFIRVERVKLPEPNHSTFLRRYVVVGGKEYELVGNFQCDFLCEFRRADEPTIYVCAAADDGTGVVVVIDPEYRKPCGKTVFCTHVCQHKKRAAKELIDKGMPALIPQQSYLSSLMALPDTIELNPDALTFWRSIQ